MPRRNYRQKPTATPRPTTRPLLQQRVACQGKRRFATERIARDAADTQELLSGQTLSIYACQWCHGWHLSSRAAQRDK